MLLTARTGAAVLALCGVLGVSAARSRRRRRGSVVAAVLELGTDLPAPR